MTENSQAFREEVALKYKVLNSIFLTLDLDGVHQTGIMLPLLTNRCEEGMKNGETPVEIINDFFEEQLQIKDEKTKIDFLFRFIQYIERQVVLIDALEDAAFEKVNDMRGPGSFRALFNDAQNRHRIKELEQALEDFKVRIVLTAHPTQFYPGSVLGIITDLAQAIEDNELAQIQKLLAQLGKTPFFKKEKPTPFDEAVSLTWFLENIFYNSIPAIYEEIYREVGADAQRILKDNQVLQLGFWPGGDRDGNPFVSIDTTRKVADRLRTSLFKCYYRDIRALKRKLTFRGIQEQVTEIEHKLYRSTFEKPNNPEISSMNSKRHLKN